MAGAVAGAVMALVAFCSSLAHKQQTVLLEQARTAVSLWHKNSSS
jgi:hypothetical protein